MRTYTEQLVIDMAVAMGGVLMSRLLSYFSKFRCSLRGWPDLYLYKLPTNESNGQVLLVEVKGLLFSFSVLINKSLCIFKLK